MSETPAPFWNRKTLMLITGASQGIGEYWAVEFSKKLAKDSVVLLWARSEAGLEATKNKVIAANPGVVVKTHAVDLSKAKGSEFNSYLSQISGSEFELCFLVNNAGSIGDVKKFAQDMKDEQEWNDYLALNVVSFATLTSSFVSLYPPSPSRETCILNVTSLAAVQPMPSFGFYCVGKAARESYLKVLATENPQLNALSYSPGPIHTNMVETILTSTASSEIKSGFTAMRDGNSFVTLAQTTDKVIKALTDRSYVSPGRIDFYDRPE
uniref:Sepiapterin reductase n=2 Tax=Cacopsylla melanoneura TaxID=428564 RepID=A0A8D9FCD8_9HEMI